MAALLLTVTMLQGLSVCFCDLRLLPCDTADCCESQGHDCHDESESSLDHTVFQHDCLHLEISNVGALIVSSRVNLTNLIFGGDFFAKHLQILKLVSLSHKFNPNTGKHILRQMSAPTLFLSDFIQVLC